MLVLLVVAPQVPLVIFAGILLAVLIIASGSWIAEIFGIPRRGGIAVFMLLTILALAGIFTALGQCVVTQVNDFIEQAPAAIEKLRESVQDVPWLDRLLVGVTCSALFSGESGAMAVGAVGSSFAGADKMVIMLFIGLFGALDPAHRRRRHDGDQRDLRSRLPRSGRPERLNGGPGEGPPQSGCITRKRSSPRAPCRRSGSIGSNGDTAARKPFHDGESHATAEEDFPFESDVRDFGSRTASTTGWITC